MSRNGYPSTKTPAPCVKMYNIVRLFLGYHSFTFSLSDLCMGVEKKIFEEIMHFHYINYIVTP